MSLFDPSANLFAFPPLPDLPINQPALGDNIAWNFEDGADYDYWSSVNGGFDDSWVCRHLGLILPWDSAQGY
jgi:hypothetical protein